MRVIMILQRVSVGFRPGAQNSAALEVLLKESTCS